MRSTRLQEQLYKYFIALKNTFDLTDYKKLLQ